MFEQPTSRLCYARATRMNLRPPCRRLLPSNQSSTYWILLADTLDFTRRCRQDQEFADVPHTLHNLHNLSSFWPFAMCRMDILGPLPKASRQVKFLLVAINYFTKWIKARPLREISSTLWLLSNIPRQEETTNEVILKALCTRLDKSKGLWKEELPNILWAYDCSPQTTTNESSFRFTYNTDAMVPVKVKEPSIRRLFF